MMTYDDLYMSLRFSLVFAPKNQFVDSLVMHTVNLQIRVQIVLLTQQYEYQATISPKHPKKAVSYEVSCGKLLNLHGRSPVNEFGTQSRQDLLGRDAICDAWLSPWGRTKQEVSVEGPYKIL